MLRIKVYWVDKELLRAGVGVTEVRSPRPPAQVPAEKGLLGPSSLCQEAERPLEKDAGPGSPGRAFCFPRRAPGLQQAVPKAMLSDAATFGGKR